MAHCGISGLEYAQSGENAESNELGETEESRNVAASGTRDTTSKCSEIKTFNPGELRYSVAFSTGQAARYCFVTADTVLNWIKAESLAAQKTAGGQYRIQASVLHRFMRDHGMSTDLLEAELDVRPLCWEYHCRRQEQLGCTDCLVNRSGAPRCYMLRGVLHPTNARPASCQECEYHLRYHRREK